MNFTRAKFTCKVRTCEFLHVLSLCLIDCNVEIAFTISNTHNRLKLYILEN